MNITIKGTITEIGGREIEVELQNDFYQSADEAQVKTAVDNLTAQVARKLIAANAA